MRRRVMPFRLFEQVAYVPLHALGVSGRVNLEHRDVEFGFIMAIPAANEDGSQDYLCRYWRRGFLGELRTVANSERTPGDCLYPVTAQCKQHLPQAVIDEAVEGILRQRAGAGK
jgi:hypothetical protein